MPLNHSGWEIRLSVEVQLVYLVVSHNDKGGPQDFLSCAAPADALNNKPCPHCTVCRADAGMRECCVAGMANVSPVLLVIPGPWAPLPWGRKKLVICKGLFCTYLPCSPLCSLQITIVPTQLCRRTWVPRAEAAGNIFVQEG